MTAPVSQEAREAAWRVRPSCYCDADKARWMSGAYDRCAEIQAFASFEQAFRKDEAERCAAVLREIASRSDDFDKADALRSAAYEIIARHTDQTGGK